MATKTREDYEREAIERNYATAQPGNYYLDNGRMEQYTGWNGGSVTGADMMAATHDSLRYKYDIMLDPRNNGGAREAIGNLLLDANEQATKMAAAGQGTYEENRQALLDQIGWTDYQSVFKNLQETGSLGLTTLSGQSIESAYGLGNPHYGAEPQELTAQELAMAQAVAAQQMGGFGGQGGFNGQGGFGGQGGAWGYDQENDPVWQAYLKQYTRAADKGMNDVLAQLSARTGGLASSYAGQVAQQTYNDYMQGATDMIPQLYDAAYGRYMDEQNMQIAADERAYQRQQDALNRQTAADQTAWERQMYADELAANERNQNLDLLLSMMGIGYQPTAQELSSVGLNQGMADAIYGDYLRGITPKTSGVSSGGGGTYKPTLTAAQVLSALESGAINDKTLADYEYYFGQAYEPGDLEVAQSAGYKDVSSRASKMDDMVGLKAYLEQSVNEGLISGDEALYLWQVYGEVETVPTSYDEFVERGGYGVRDLGLLKQWQWEQNDNMGKPDGYRSYQEYLAAMWQKLKQGG